MADATLSTMLIVSESDTGVQDPQASCGCCKAEVETVDDVIRELEGRRAALDARLAGIRAR